MDKGTLKTLRLLIPGIISVFIFLLFYSIIKKKDVFDLKLIDYSYITIISLVIGAIYYLFEIRNWVTGFSHKRIDLNIKSNIISLCTRSLTPNQQQYLYQSNRLKDIFYKVIDNEESLKIKGTSVYFNGLIWTSTADAFILIGFGSLIFFLSAFHFDDLKPTLLIWSLALIITSLFSFFLHLLSYYKHIKLSNDQIEYIETHCIANLNSIINDVLQQVP